MNLKEYTFIIIFALGVILENCLAYDQLLSPQKWMNLGVALTPLSIALIVDGGIILAIIVFGVNNHEVR